MVIGGGLHGCSAALHLALRGLSVMVFEKDTVGRHASGVNAGGVRRLGRALPEVPLAVASAKMWHEIETLVDDDCGFESSCQIKVAESPAELAQLEHRAAQLRQLGFGHENIIDKETLNDLLPAVSPHCTGAMIVEGDGHANPFRTVQMFKRACGNKGVSFKQGARVCKISRRSNIWQVRTTEHIVEAPYLINCAGAWAGRIADMLGEPVPLEARAPMLMITARLPAFITPVVGAQGRALSFKQFANGTVLIGGGHEGQANTETNSTQLDYAGLATSARTAASIFPIMGSAQVVRCWAGIEGFMPDRLPVIGRSQAEAAFHAFGFSAHGFQLGPVSGKIISDLLVDGETTLPVEPFCISRFD